MPPVQELGAGLWHWQAVHPEWGEGEPWDPTVSSYAIDDGERLLLFDPMPPPSEIEQLATERDTAIVLTAPWHERDSEGLVQRLGVPVYTPLPDSAEYLMQKYGITAEQAGDGSPDRRLAPQGGERRGPSVDGGRSSGRRGPGVPRAEAERSGALGREPQCGRRRRSSEPMPVTAGKRRPR
jgi:hypothetical protein